MLMAAARRTQGVGEAGRDRPGKPVVGYIGATQKHLPVLREGVLTFHHVRLVPSFDVV